MHSCLLHPPAGGRVLTTLVHVGGWYHGDRYSLIRTADSNPRTWRADLAGRAEHLPLRKGMPHIRAAAWMPASPGFGWGVLLYQACAPLHHLCRSGWPCSAGCHYQGKSCTASKPASCALVVTLNCKAFTVRLAGKRVGVNLGSDRSWLLQGWTACLIQPHPLFSVSQRFQRALQRSGHAL